ncbi:UPF0481 protein At3g47200-like [Cornus florida]|uniref:UPF0481 protein At3g47200-like n=1 Tax=Cornus florida TaxID=4283 RepID=UPI00289B4C4D|nr:UPF0481 protein At3g47200-like [Cornus florida]
MYQQGADYISILIDSVELPPLFHTSSEPYIFRVDNLLRRVNEQAYEPEMVAIGPYHHGKHHLEMMEVHKLRYAHQFLSGSNAMMSVDEYVTSLSELEDEIRDFYAEPIPLDSRELMGMMLIDGFFIIELLCKFCKKQPVDEDGPIFRTARMLRYLKRDLLLFENQIPFFVLTKLFNMTKFSLPQDDLVLVDMALEFLGNRLPHTCSKKVNVSDEVDHLLGLVHFIWTPSTAYEAYHQEVEEPFIGCTINLQRVGILFRKAANGNSLFDINFKNGVMEIPSLSINDETECLLRNLIAYEQYQQNGRGKYVTDYATLMDCLINSEKDVEELCSRGIFKNRLANDEALSDMFNELCRNVVVNPRNFCYSQVFDRVNKHSALTYRRALGEIRYHLRNPMTVLNLEISMLALLLAAIQIIIPFCIKT